MHRAKEYQVNPSQTLRDTSPNQTIRLKRGTRTPNLSRNGSYLDNIHPESPPKDSIVYPPNKSYVLQNLHNRYEKKYPSYQIQKHLTYKLNRGESLNTSQVLDTEEEQHILQSLRKERDARKLINIKPTGSPTIGPVLVNRYVKEMKLDKQKSMHSRPKHKSSHNSFDNEYDSPTEDIRNSTILPMGYYTSNKQNLDSSLPYLLRIDDIHNGPRDNSRTNLAPKAVKARSRDIFKKESKLVIDKSELEGSDKMKEPIGELDKNSVPTTENTQPDAGLDKITAFKLLYQKYKNPSNRKNIINPDTSIQKEANMTNSTIFSFTRPHFATIKEEKQTKEQTERAKKVSFRTKRNDPNKSIRSPSEGSPTMNHSFLGKKHQILKKRNEPLDDIKKGFILIEQQAKDFHKGLIQDKSDHQIKALSGEVNRAYKDFDKGLTSKKAGQYNFPAFVKSLLQKTQKATQNVPTNSQLELKVA